MNESEVMQRFIIAILKQAVMDAAKEENNREKIDAQIFIKSEYCEFMCFVIAINYDVFKNLKQGL